MSGLRFVAIVAAVVWLAFSPVAGAGEFPKGTFTASPQKDWSIRFEDQGKLTVLRGGKTVVEGTYKVSDNEVTLTDVKGLYAAKEEGEKTGKYRWKLEGGKLRFTVVEDQSKGRELLLTMNEWVGPK
jgi:hypothetical protein